MQNNKDNFVDQNLTVYDFGDRFDVECPNCNKQALVKLVSEPIRSARFSCVHCGTTSLWNGDHSVVYKNNNVEPKSGYVCIGGPFDWYFHYPLILRSPCCSQILWAYNSAHLDYLEEFISAKQRKRNHEPYGNNTLASRLPTWMTAQHNRAEVVKCIEKIRSKHIKTSDVIASARSARDSDTSI